MKKQTASAVSILALACAAHAQGPERIDAGSVFIPTDEIAAQRSMLRDPARTTPRRSLLHPSARGAFGFEDTLDGLDSDQALPQDGPGLYVRQGGFPSAAFPGALLAGQLNPDGRAWQSTNWGGIVDNAAAITNTDGDPLNGEYNGPPGGPDPTGERGGMLHVQRSSVNDGPIDEGSGVETYEFFTDLYTGTSTEPLFVEIDLYKPTHETFQWLRPISYTEGFFLTGLLFGGFQSGGLFEPFAEMFGDPDVIEGVVILEQAFKTSEFVASPKEIPEDGWFTVGLMINPGAFMAIFVRDAETLADNDTDGSPDWKMPMNPETGLRMFEEYGYGLEEGWASVYPGTLDDPMTTDTEGAGYARNGVGGPPDRFFFNGNDVARIFSGVSFDAMRLYHGSDPSPTVDPDYEMKDWWWDHIRVRGKRVQVPNDPPAYSIPYHDDFEQWSEGPLWIVAPQRWSANGFDNAPEITALQNHTPANERGDAPSQSLRITNVRQRDDFGFAAVTSLPTTPRVRGEAGDPAIISTTLRLESTMNSFGLEAAESGAAVDIFRSAPFNREDALESMVRVWTSCIDPTGLSDGRVYVRQRKPIGSDVAGGEYDPLGPLTLAAAPNRTPDQEATINTTHVNVLAAPAGQTELVLPSDQWVTFIAWGEPDAGGARGGESGDPHQVRLFVSIDDAPLIELFPDGDSARRFRTRSIAPTDLRFTSSNSPLAGYTSLFVDDVFFDGPTQTDTLAPLSAPFTDDPLWELPFADPLDTYAKGRPATPQGYADHRLEFMPILAPDLSPLPNDWDRLELIAGAPPLTNGEPVRVYEIISIDAGSPGFATSDLVAVRDDIPREYDPDADIYGLDQDDGHPSTFFPTEWRILDAVGGAETARGTWGLASKTGAAVFDDAVHTDAGARYSYRHDFRFTGTARENEFVSAAEEGVDSARGSRGDVVKLTNRGNRRPRGSYFDPSFDEVEMFEIFMPLAQTDEENFDAAARFDVYIGQSEFETGFHVRIDGGTADGGAITGLSFGGLGFQSGNALGGPPPMLPTGEFGRLVMNPSPGPGDPDTIWEGTGVSVPAEQWFTVEIVVNRDSEYRISIDDQEIVSGVAIDASEPTRNTNSLDRLVFVRNMFGKRDGQPTPGGVRWSARAFDAPAPFAGSDAYHFYRIDEPPDVEPGQSAPLIWPVDPNTGVPETDMTGQPETRELDWFDYVAIVNTDPTTGQPFPYPFISLEWDVTDAGGAVTRATGFWEPVGQPASPTYLSPPAGGVVAGSGPPYNAQSPFLNMLLADYVEVLPSTLFPSDVWYLDNFELVLPLTPTCTGNIVSFDNAVNAGDLAALLADWGQTDSPANLDGVGVVNAGDLAILLAAWGPCPTP